MSSINIDSLPKKRLLTAEQAGIYDTVKYCIANDGVRIAHNDGRRIHMMRDKDKLYIKYRGAEDRLPIVKAYNYRVLIRNVFDWLESVDAYRSH